MALYGFLPTKAGIFTRMRLIVAEANSRRFVIVSLQCLDDMPIAEVETQLRKMLNPELFMVEKITVFEAADEDR